MKKTILKIVIGISIFLNSACAAIPDRTTPSPGTTIPLSTSGDSRIVFVKNIYGKFEGLYTMDPQGNNVSRIPNVCLTRFVSPTWSPTGKWIAFGCQNGEGEQNLCVSDAKGQTLDQTLLGDVRGCHSYQGLINRDKVPEEFCVGAVQSVTWSPDGNRLAIGCSGVICLIDLDGSTDCWLLSNVIDEGIPVDGITTVDWSPISNLLLLNVRNSIYQVNIDNMKARFLVDGWSPRWSPDGNQLAFFRSSAKVTL